MLLASFKNYKLLLILIKTGHFKNPVMLYFAPNYAVRHQFGYENQSCGIYVRNMFEDTFLRRYQREETSTPSGGI